MEAMKSARPIPLLLSLAFGALTLLGCAECATDYDCPGTQICSAEEAQCVPFVCRANRDCAPGNTCSANRCQETPDREAPSTGEPVVLQPAD